MSPQVEAAGIEPETFSDGSDNGATTYEFCPTCRAAWALHENDFNCRCMTLDSRLKPIIEAWAELSEASRQAVEAICLQSASSCKNKNVH